MHAIEDVVGTKALNDPDFLRQVNELRRTDNTTNWYYLAREYVFLVLILTPTVCLFEAIRRGDVSWLWAVLVTPLVILCVGASQHRLATLAHEAVHYILFKNRLLNEVVSEWFCMLPILGDTHKYRIQHLGHHQYPNDPERDPDWGQMLKSGHKYRFPMSRGQFLWKCFFKQLLWVPALLRYILVRATFLVDGDGPYRMKRRTAPVLGLAGLAYHLALAGCLVCGVLAENWLLLAVIPVNLLVSMVLLLSLAPDEWFAKYAIVSDLPTRWQSRMRIVFNTLLLTSLAWLTVLTGAPAWLYYFVLWLIPLGTTFSLFMILRQLVQHGNADRERFTNTRIFRVHPLLSMSVFPLGMDYHLPHHLFPLVPHYNLRKLHAMLLDVADYREQGVIVEGYFFPRERPPLYPTVLDIMTR